MGKLTNGWRFTSPFHRTKRRRPGALRSVLASSRLVQDFQRQWWDLQGDGFASILNPTATGFLYSIYPVSGRGSPAAQHQTAALANEETF